MICQTGTVVAISAAHVSVEFDRAPACLGCASGRGCGLGPVLEMFRSPRRARLELPAKPGHGLRVGQRVRAGVRPADFLAGVGLAYVLPTVGILVGAASAAALFPAAGDPAAVAGAGLGLLAGCVALAAKGRSARVALLN